MEHFNKLTPAEHERLALLLEEMGETQHVIGKILRHGYQSYHPDDADKVPNRTLLATEVGHVWAAIRLLVKHQDIGGFIMHEMCADKEEKVKKWLHHQE